MLTMECTTTLKDLSRFRNELEAQWAVFLTTWGVKYRYSPGLLDEDGLDVPAFFIPSCRVWLEVYPRGEQHNVEELLEVRSDFARRARGHLLCVFGGPCLRAPEHHGWGLRWSEEGLKAFAFHMIACPRCGGFCAASLGTLENQREEPETYLRLLEQATILDGAYRVASQVRMFAN